MSPANRRKIPVALGRRVRQLARYRCGYYLCSEALLGMPMEFDHLMPQAAGAQLAKRIYGSPAAAATPSRARKRMPATRMAQSGWRYSTHASSCGLTTLRGVRMVQKSLAKPRVDGRQLLHSR